MQGIRFCFPYIFVFYFCLRTERKKTLIAIVLSETMNITKHLGYGKPLSYMDAVQVLTLETPRMNVGHQRLE